MNRLDWDELYIMVVARASSQMYCKIYVLRFVFAIFSVMWSKLSEIIGLFFWIEEYMVKISQGNTAFALAKADAPNQAEVALGNMATPESSLQPRPTVD